MVKKMKKVFPVNNVVDKNISSTFAHQCLRSMIVLRSKMMKYHILKISTTRATLINFLKLFGEVCCLTSLGIIFHILSPNKEIPSLAW